MLFKKTDADKLGVVSFDIDNIPVIKPEKVVYKVGDLDLGKVKPIVWEDIPDFSTDPLISSGEISLALSGKKNCDPLIWVA